VTERGDAEDWRPFIFPLNFEKLSIENQTVICFKIGFNENIHGFCVLKKKNEYTLKSVSMSGR
jgi:hypothetical protein